MSEFDVNELKEFLKKSESEKDEKIITKILDGQKLSPEELKRAFQWSLPFFTLAVLNKNFEKNKVLAKKEWEESKKVKLEDIGSVKHLEILPLIDKQTEGDLLTESGVAYLIKADDKTILFDAGLNKNKEHPSPLLKNMESLGVKVEDIDIVVISHKHGDHTGGGKWARKDTFGLSGEQLDLAHIKAYTPEPMTHPSATVIYVDKPKKIANGVASIGTIRSPFFLIGMLAEQSMIVNVEGKGIVIIVGCGHQGVRKIIDRTETLIDILIYGIIGGIHLPFPKFPDAEPWLELPIHKFFGTRRPIWEPWTENDTLDAVKCLKKRNPKLVSISPHDSSIESIETFRKEFKSFYIDLKVGKKIVLVSE